MITQTRWICASCRREWLFSTGPDGVCLGCGQTDASRVTFQGFFDSQTPPDVWTGPLLPPNQLDPHEVTAVLPPPLSLLADPSALAQDWIGLAEGAW